MAVVASIFAVVDDAVALLGATAGCEFGTIDGEVGWCSGVVTEAFSAASVPAFCGVAGITVAFGECIGVVLLTPVPSPLRIEVAELVAAALTGILGVGNSL